MNEAFIKIPTNNDKFIELRVTRPDDESLWTMNMTNEALEDITKILEETL